MVEGKTGCVERTRLASRSGFGRQVVARYAGLEDEFFERFGDAGAVIQDEQSPVATFVENRCNVDVAGAGIAGVA